MSALSWADRLRALYRGNNFLSPGSYGELADHLDAQDAEIARLTAEQAQLLVERDLADSPHHVIDFRANGWTVKHPLACRPSLFDCPVNRAAEQLDRAPVDLGRFECEERNGHLIIGNATTAPNPSGGESGA